ncbi:alpha/beta-hydrolase [Corynespora cassiicola Philippines]|uniref:Alpha/beta-hydrolase n=1 Tax=Corynespora cassiicola Philippines TaxID=1448308 RepID=A0A2T2N1W1_CORCC|nr:alpha/beta-hydrolase [Corynespora cassiicola Philippines]
MQLLESLGHWLLAYESFATAFAGRSPPRREYFYVGGEYKNMTLGNTTDLYMVGQIYVEKLTPANASRAHPIVFVHGSAQTATNWLETPDGRPGWASFFLDHGFTVYLSDQPSRGRSPWHPSVGSMTAISAPFIETYFTATSDHELWPQSRLHTQWPGTGHVGDPTFDAFYSAQVQFQGDELISEETNAKAYSALLDKVGKSFLLTHSQSGAYGWRVGDARPRLVQGIISLEPSGPPFLGWPVPTPSRPWGLTNLAMEYEPPAGPNATYMETVTVPAKDANHTDCILQSEPAKKLKNLADVPVLAMTGEASFHAPYDYCTAGYLQQAGVGVEHVELGKEGIKGNGHMLFMEKNNLQIAGRVLRWMEEHA